MRLHLGLTGLALWLITSGLTACTAQTLLSAEQLIAPTSTATLPPAVTVTATVVTVTRTPAHTLMPSPTPTQTATVPPTATEVPTQSESTAELTPIPAGPPVPDGVVRTADLPILMYHYISASPSAQDRTRVALSVPPEMFEAQLKLLHDNGFTTVTLRDLYEYLATGKQLPERPIILTFDDGYIDNYTNAFRLLQQYRMIGTFFVLTGPADDGDPTYLSWDMIQEMSNAGMDIQLHSREHLDMRNRSYDWLVFQIIGGRQSIEGHTGKPVIFMAYPSGKYDASVQRFLSSTDFWAAVTTAAGSRHALKDALNWDRRRISGQLRLPDFAKLLGINVASLRVTPQSTAAPSETSPSNDRPASLTPTAPLPAATAPIPGETISPTRTPIGSPPITPTGTLPSPTPTSEGPISPTRTPISSPLITPTSVQSPLPTPAP